MSETVIKNIKLMYEFNDCCMTIKPSTKVTIEDIHGNTYETDANSVKITSHSIIGFHVNNTYKVIPLCLIKEINYICENYQPF